MTFSIQPAVLSQTSFSQHEIHLLNSVRTQIERQSPQGIPILIREYQSDWQALCSKLEKVGQMEEASNPLRQLETNLDNQVTALCHQILAATLATLVSQGGETGYYATQALLKGAEMVSGKSILGFSKSCMSLEMIDELLVENSVAQRAAEDIRAGQIPNRPIYFVAPPGAGFGEWFGVQKFATDAKTATKHPAQALAEWGQYVDELSNHADVFVIPYVSSRDSSIWRIVYSANGPQIFEVDDELYAVLPNLSHLGRQGEHRWFHEFLLRLGIPASHIYQPPQFQEGQADFSRPIPVANGDPLLFLGYGIRTPEASVYEPLRRFKVKDAKGEREVDLLKNFQTISIRMNSNSYAFHQDTWLNVVRNRDGMLHALYAPDWIHETDRQRFANILDQHQIPAIPFGDEDAKAYVANANEVGGNMFLVKGGPYEISKPLRQKLTDRNFGIIEGNYDEVYSKAGGGTRCMVNELRGINLAKHPEFAAKMQQFRYQPQAWKRIAPQYPQVYAPGRRFV